MTALSKEAPQLMAQTAFVDQSSDGQIHGGSKAKSDAARIMIRAGFRPLKLGGRTRVVAALNAMRFVLFAFFGPRSNVIVHFPIYNRSAQGLIKMLRVRHSIIRLVHDIDQARDVAPTEELLGLIDADAAIISGKLDQIPGFEDKFPSRRVHLSAWDYLTDLTCPQTGDGDKIIFAGSLDRGKAAWIYDPQRTISLVFAGRGYEKDAGLAIDEFVGSFDPENPEFPSNVGWGLIWDGSQIDRLAGPTGRYQLYNQPHKFSLYIAAGLPIICNTEAAVAPMVTEWGIGVCVNALNDIPHVLSQISDVDRRAIISNVNRARKTVTLGLGLRTALDDIQKVQ